MQRPRLGAEQPRLSAAIRRTLDTAMKQSGHSLRRRLETSCAMAPRDVDALTYAAGDLVWQRITQVEHSIADNADEPDVQEFLQVVAAQSDEFRAVLTRLVDSSAVGAFLEGWVAGTIYAFEKADARKHARRGMPGR